MDEIKQTKFYLNGQPIPKQTYNKYLKWARILRAISKDTCRLFQLREVFGAGVSSHLARMLQDDIVTLYGRSNQTFYSVTIKGQQLMVDINNNMEEK